jgi:hypothetical protein
LPFSYLFDLEHFVNAFSTGCPQITLYESEDAVLESFSSVKGIGDELPLTLSSLPNRHYFTDGGTVFTDIETLRPVFDDWLHDKRFTPPFSAKKPIVITIIFPLLRWPMTYDPPEFTATFGRIIKVRENIRRLPAVVMFALSEIYSLDITPGGIIEPGKYFGVHLRTAVDTIGVGWPQYDFQAPNYLKGAQQSKLSVIYLATGNESDIARFTKSANELGLDVATKTDLLDQPGLEVEKQEMEELNWDQKGMVDYEVLLWSSKFAGVFESSFSWSISNRRHVVEAGGTWDMIYEGHQGVNMKAKDDEGFKDSFSTIYGPKDLGKLRWQFPLGLWP